jgi:hypothetical protein
MNVNEICRRFIFEIQEYPCPKEKEWTLPLETTEFCSELEVTIAASSLDTLRPIFV